MPPSFGMGARYAGALPASTTATVTANLTATSNVIPADFIGIGTATYDVIADDIWVTSNTTLLSLMQMLGPNGHIRFGGGGTDLTPTPPALTQNIANHIAAFVEALGPGWHATYALDGLVDDSAVALTQAQYVINAFGSDKVALEVGNEPDFWPGASATKFRNIFNAYYAAVNAVLPGLDWDSPATNYDTLQSYQSGLSLASPAGFHYIAQHFYLWGNPFVPTQQMVTDSIADNSSKLTQNIAYAAGKLRLEETNIEYNGGLIGLTDRLIDTMWLIKLANFTAAAGWAGINPHNAIAPSNFLGVNRPAYYNQFIKNGDGTYSPKPGYYALFLFSKMQGNTIISTTNTSLDSGASALAVKRGDGNASIIITNGNITRDISVVIDQDDTWSTANLYLLSGTSAYDTNPTLNGFAMGPGGSWAGSVATLHRGNAITIPPCGVALAEIQ